jgi:Xaa-Pro aminopeptidase
MQRMADRAVKRTRVLELLDETGRDAIILSSATTVGWYLDGGRPGVSLATDPIVAVRVSRAGDEVFTTSNETARLLAEELPADVTVRDRPWFESPPALDGVREEVVAHRLREARVPLLRGETARFRVLAADTARAMTDALLIVLPTWPERRLAAEVAAGVIAAGAEPLVVLVGGASRAGIPHPLPTDAPLGRRAMAVVCARRDGLVANLSRWVSFGAETDAERSAARRILDVEAATLDATRPGTPLSAVLEAIASAYLAAGFPADQWRRHHQGGAAGYAGRDPRATPDTDDMVRLGQAFAWNPWVPGAKVEDTVLLTGTSEPTRFEVLTFDPRWPTASVAGRRRPVTLER